MGLKASDAGTNKRNKSVRQLYFLNELKVHSASPTLKSDWLSSVEKMGTEKLYQLNRLIPFVLGN